MVKYFKHLIFYACIVIACTVTLMAGAVFYLKSDAFLDRALSTVNTGIPGIILASHHEISLLSGTVGLKDVVIKDPDGNDVISCNQLRITLSYGWLLQQTLMMKAVTLDHPEIDFRINEKGQFNLLSAFIDPNPPAKKKKAKRIPFNIVIRELNLINGAFCFALSGNRFVFVVQDIDIHADGNLRKESASLDLTAGEGSAGTRAFNIHLSRPIKIKGQLDHNRIESLNIQTGTEYADITLSGDIENVFSTPEMHLMVNVNLSLAEIQNVFSIHPKVEGQAKANLTFSGPLKNPTIQLMLQVDKGEILKTPVENFSLDAKLNNHIFQCNSLKFNIFKSLVDITGQADLRPVFPHGLTGAKKDVRYLTYLAHVKQKNGRLEFLPWFKKHLKGRFDSELNLSGQGANVSGDLCLSAGGIRADKTAAPIDLHMNTSVSFENGIGIVDCLKVNSDAVTIDGEGMVNVMNGSLNAGLFMLSPELDMFLAALGLKGIAGSASLNTTVTGTIRHPQVDFLASVKNLSVFPLNAGHVTAIGTFADDGLTIHQAYIQNNRSGLGAHGKIKLFEPDTFMLKSVPDVSVTIDESTLFLEDFIHTGKGRIGLSGHVSGPVNNPEGTLTILGTDMDTGVQKLSALHGKFAFNNHKVNLTSLTGTFSDSESFTANGWVAFDKAFQVSMTSKGIPLKDIDWLRDRSISKGLLDFTVNGSGTIDNPMFDGDVHLTQFEVQEQQLEDFQIHLNVKDNTLNITGKIDANIDTTIALPTRQFTADITCSDTDLAPYFNVLKMPGYSGMVSGKIHLHGDLDQPTDIIASADVSEVRIFHNKLKLADAGPFKASYRNHVITVPDTRIDLLNTSKLDVSGEIDLNGPLSIRARGRIPMNTLALYIDELYDIQGTTNLDATITGTIKDPDIQAELTCSGLEFTIPELYQRLYDGKGTIRLTRDKIIIDGFSGKIDTGEFRISGSVDIEKFTPVFLDVNLNLSSLPVYLPDTMDVYLNADLNIKGSQKKSVAGGDIVLIEGVYYKDIKLMPLDIIKNVTTKRRKITPETPETDLPFLKNMTLDIDVKQRSPFLVDNNIAQLSMHTDVNMTGNLLRPIISGQTKINEGLILYLKREFNVKSGVIDFINPYKTEPYINISGEITIRKYTIMLKVTGEPEHLGFEFSSTSPELSQEDILSLIIIGRTRSEIENPEQQPQMSTSEMLAGMLASTFQREIKKTTGLDYLEVETDEDEDDTSGDDDTREDGKTPSQRIKVTFGKQLTKRLTMKYAVESKRGEMNQEVLSEYKFIENIIFNGSYDTQGEFGGEFVYRLEFR